MISYLRPSAFFAALVAAAVGFGGTMALVLSAAQSVGASPAQTESWVSAICVSVSLITFILTLRYRMPIIGAWSIAGHALITASSGYTMPEAVGAFVVAGMLMVATGLFKPLMRLVDAIPQSISAGMLGGVLLPFVIGGAHAAVDDPAFVLPLAAGFFVLRVFSPSLAVIALLAAGAAWAVVSGRAVPDVAISISTLTFIGPQLSLGATLGLAIPLYVVTMASQNLPGLAVLHADGYRPPAGPVIATTGFFSALTAFAGAASTNLAAVTAAICTGDEAHRDRDKRFMAGIWYGLIYAALAMFGASLVRLVSAMPATLVALVLALALLGPLANSTRIAVTDEDSRVAAMTTFAVTASGIVVLGVGAAFWGLSVGLLVHFLARLKR